MDRVLGVEGRAVKKGGIIILACSKPLRPTRWLINLKGTS